MPPQHRTSIAPLAPVPASSGSVPRSRSAFPPRRNRDSRLIAAQARRVRGEPAASRRSCTFRPGSRPPPPSSRHTAAPGPVDHLNPAGTALRALGAPLVRGPARQLWEPQPRALPDAWATQAARSCAAVAGMADAPSSPNRCGKRGQQVRRWLERRGRRAVRPRPAQPPQRSRRLPLPRQWTLPSSSCRCKA